MLNLYAVNLHLEGRLQQDGRNEVRAAEAVCRLDKASLLRNHKNDLLPQKLLCAGCIISREQRINTKNGLWSIRDRPPVQRRLHRRGKRTEPVPSDGHRANLKGSALARFEVLSPFMVPCQISDVHRWP